MCNCKSLLLQEKAKHREQTFRGKKATDLSEIAKSFEHSEKLQLFLEEGRNMCRVKTSDSTEIQTISGDFLSICLETAVATQD